MDYDYTKILREHWEAMQATEASDFIPQATKDELYDFYVTLKKTPKKDWPVESASE